MGTNELSNAETPAPTYDELLSLLTEGRELVENVSPVAGDEWADQTAAWQMRAARFAVAVEAITAQVAV